MVITIKKISYFILIFLAFLLSGLVLISELDYYETLNLPRFAPNPQVFRVLFLIYLLVSYVIVVLLIKYQNKNLKDFTVVFISNYIMNILFTPLFFGFKKMFLGVIVSVGTFITAIFLLIETRKIDKRLSWLFLPYIIFSLFMSILFFNIFLIN